MTDQQALPRVTVMSLRTEAARGNRISVPPAVDLTGDAAIAEVLTRSLIRVQLGLALRVLAVFGSVLGGLPLLFALVPAIGRVEFVGVPLPWIMLGVASFPLLVALAVVYARQAERNEREFAELVRRR